MLAPTQMTNPQNPTDNASEIPSTKTNAINLPIVFLPNKQAATAILLVIHRDDDLIDHAI